MASRSEALEPRRVGRYLLYEPIASGGMATVFYGAILGESGFSRTVAIKRVRADKRSTRLTNSLIDEARIASRIKHPNVVDILDVVSHDDETLIVLAYVAGESLSALLRQLRKMDKKVPVRIAAGIVAGILHGLHAAHEAKSVSGAPLAIVHRDVSPQNVLLGADGVARVLDFGIAKAEERLSKTAHGQVKGKPAYLAPEQVQGRSDRRTDVYAAGVVLWELLTGRRLFSAKNRAEVIEMLLEMRVEAPSRHRAEVDAELDEVVMRALARDPGERFETAEAFALALEDRIGVATTAQIGRWVSDIAGDVLAERAQHVERLERDAARRAGQRSGAIETASPAASASRPVDGGAEVTEVDETVSTRIYARPAPREPARDGHTAEDAGSDEVSEPVTSGSSPPSEVPVAPTETGRGQWWVAIGAIVVGAVSIYVLLRDPPAATRAPVTAQPTFATALAPEPPRVPASGASSDHQPVVEPPPSPLPDAPSSQPPPSAASAPPATPPPPSASSRPPAPQGDPCKPPWRWMDGIKVPKPECG